mmetsp:Transcript_24207/g.39516  ORF Transcript_24207/g.39516 Transcript_24207/m.39516 type:complete len:1286 (+) Transcript_24207:228-4085(+)
MYDRNLPSTISREDRQDMMYSIDESDGDYRYVSHSISAEVPAVADKEVTNTSHDSEDSSYDRPEGTPHGSLSMYCSSDSASPVQMRKKSHYTTKASKNSNFVWMTPLLIAILTAATQTTAVMCIPSSLFATALPPRTETLHGWKKQTHADGVVFARKMLHGDGKGNHTDGWWKTTNKETPATRESRRSRRVQVDAEERKELRVCSVPNILDITRLRSRETRAIFSAAIEDVELMREYFAEAMYNQGLQGGLSTLDGLAQSFDWEGRGLGALFEEMTTIEAGLGWVDDRPDRRMERYMATTSSQPIVGTKETDLKAFDSSSNIFPWIVDRRSRENHWYLDHQNGRSQGANKEPLVAEKLYTAAWAATWSDGILYYPPLTVYTEGEPLTLGDSGNVGPNWNGREDPATMTGHPDQNPRREAILLPPYPDVAQPGKSLISATAPVYFTGTFNGYEYVDTYLATTGLDIDLTSIASVFADLEDRLALGSFALLVDSQTFKVVSISQSVVQKIFPTRTGNETSRSEDRRNQPYLVSDTIFQPLIDEGVTSANWSLLQQLVLFETKRGERNYMVLNITLTGEEEPQEYYAAFERWEYIADWSLLVFSPVPRVDNAIHPVLNFDEFNSETVQGEPVTDTVTVRNDGFLEFHMAPMASKNPNWIEVLGRKLLSPEGEVLPLNTSVYGDGVVLKPGESVEVTFRVNTDSLKPGTVSSPFSFLITDYKYPDCFYSQPLSLSVTVLVTPVIDLNQLGAIRAVGLALAGCVVLLALYCVFWVYRGRVTRVVRASQPLFLVMIAFGSLLMALTIVPLSIDDGVASIRGCDMACMASPWLFSVGFVTTFAALFSKIWRINKIFQSNRFKRVKVTEKDVLVPFVSLFILNFGLLLSWTIVDPLTWDRVYTDDFNSYGRCVGHGRSHLFFLAAIGFIDLCALVLACVQAYKARGISDEYSETKYIAIAIGGWIQVVLVGLPLMFLVSENPSASFFIKSCIIFAISLAMLLLIFVPKMAVNRKSAAENKRATQSAEVTRIMNRAAAYSAQQSASAPPNLETYRVSSLQSNNTISQNSEAEVSMEMTDFNSSGSTAEGFKIIGSVQTDQQKLAETLEDNKSLAKQFKREKREVERLKKLLIENGIDPSPRTERMRAISENGCTGEQKCVHFHQDSGLHLKDTWGEAVRDELKKQGVSVDDSGFSRSRSVSPALEETPESLAVTPKKKPQRPTAFVGVNFAGEIDPDSDISGDLQVQDKEKVKSMPDDGYDAGEDLIDKEPQKGSTEDSTEVEEEKKCSPEERV